MAQNGEKPIVKKVEVSEWPVVSGDYVIGDPKGSIAVVTLGSAGLVKEAVKQPGVALAGECKTENVGIEKVVLNVISNPNIRFLLVCGAEVAGHVTGGTFKAFFEHGVDPESKRIRRAPGAIPYLEALPVEAAERFRKQVQFIDMINTEEVGQVTAKIKELTVQDPGAYPEPPLIIKTAEKEEAEGEGFRIPLMISLPPALKITEKILDDIEFKVRLISRERRMSLGVENSRFIGTLTGFLAAIGILTLILALGV